MQEEIDSEKKIDKKKERAQRKRKERKQEAKLNAFSNGKWRRLGSFATWVGYRVEIDGQTEVIPVRRKTTTPQLINIVNNVKRAIKKEKIIKEKNNKNAKKRTRKKRAI